MINALQIIVNVPLFSISFPANAAMFYSFVANIATFNIFPTTTMEDYLFKFGNFTPFNDNFNTMDIF